MLHPGFFLEVVDAVTIGGEKVGSNRIRKLLQFGEVGMPTSCLDPYMISGDRSGRAGKDIWFSTINLKTDFNLSSNGIYKPGRIPGKILPSVFGHSPFGVRNVPSKRSCQLRWRPLRTVFLFMRRIREGVNDVSDLRAQIEQDVAAAGVLRRARETG
jgi:hypothetical protein